ncbi:hypothetical protein GZL_09222 [Streptomyces sp. 769]|nr:hypothetical protein GZL_09222 [Streptomyces sp. 769]
MWGAAAGIAELEGASRVLPCADRARPFLGRAATARGR